VLFQILKSASIRKVEYSKDDLAGMAAFVFSREKAVLPGELTLEFTGPGRIRSLNRRFRGVDRNTDVIAFRYSNSLSFGERGGARGWSGDIAINVPQARLQARKMRHPPKREIRLLFIHGMLHLLGYTDYEPAPRRRMFKRQNQLLRRWENHA
jgi:probable rRNA maturation factor